MIKITKDFYIERSKILFVSAYDSTSIKNLVTKRKNEERVIDITRRRKINSVIVLINGDVVLSNTAIVTINQRMTNEPIAKEI